jgi:WD40 repeat protein
VFSLSLSLYFGRSSSHRERTQKHRDPSLTLHHNSHSGPVWQIAWAHPSFGPILASCSYDGRVYVWKEVAQAAGGGRGGGGVGMGGSAGARDGPGEWEKIKEHGAHGASGEFSLLSGPTAPSIQDVVSASRLNVTVSVYFASTKSTRSVGLLTSLDQSSLVQAATARSRY